MKARWIVDNEPNLKTQLQQAAERQRALAGRQSDDDGVPWLPGHQPKPMESLAKEALGRFQLNPRKPVVELTEEQQAEALRREEAVRARHVEAEKRIDQQRRTDNWRDVKDALGIKHADATLRDWEYWGTNEAQQAQRENIEKLRAFLSDANTQIGSGRNIIWTGTRGTGKDHQMAACLRHVVLACGYKARRMYGPNLFLALRGLMSKGSKETEQELIHKLSRTPILALSDPLPTIGGLTPYQSDALLTVVDERYRNQRPIWVTLNVESREDAEARLGGLLVDRLFENSLILFSSWPSYRQYKQGQALEATTSTVTTK